MSKLYKTYVEFVCQICTKRESNLYDKMYLEYNKVAFFVLFLHSRVTVRVNAKDAVQPYKTKFFLVIRIGNIEAFLRFPRWYCKYTIFALFKLLPILCPSFLDGKYTTSMIASFVNRRSS